MKKATLIAAVAALALSTGAATAQNRPKYTVRQGHVERFATPALPSDSLPASPASLTAHAGEHLQRSAALSYVSVGTGVAAGIFAGVASLMDDDYDMQGNKTKDLKGARVATWSLCAASAVTSLASACLAVNHRYQAGKCLRLSATPSGLALAWQF